MRVPYVLPTALLLFASLLRGQVDLGEIARQKGSEIKGKALRKAREKAIAQIEKQKAEFDASNFNYAISFLDNAGTFEAKEKGSAFSGALLSFEKTMAHEEISRRERAYNAMRNGEVLLAVNRFYLAEQNFRIARFLYEEDGAQQLAEYAQVVQDQALLYLTWGRYSKAEPLAKEALTLAEKLDNTSSRIVAMNNLSVLLREKGEYAASESRFRTAIREASEEKNTLAVAVLQNNLGMALVDMNRLKEAESAIATAVTEASRTLPENAWNYIRLQVNLACVYRLQKKYPLAESIYTRAIAVKEKKLGVHPDVAHLKRGLAQVYVDMGKMAEAEKLLVSALDVNRRKLGDHHPATVSTMQELGNLLRFSGNVAKARELLRKAESEKKELYGESHPQRTRALEDLALAEWVAGDTKAAREGYEKVLYNTFAQGRRLLPSLTDAARSQYWDKVSERIQRFYAFALSAISRDTTMDRLMYGTVINARGLLLDNSVKLRESISASHDEELKKLYAQWKDTREALNASYELTQKEVTDEHVNRDSIANRAAELERALAARNTLFAETMNTAPVLPQQVQSQLARDEAAVEIIAVKEYSNGLTGKERYVALIVRQGKITLAEIGDGEMVRERVKMFRAAIHDKKVDPEAYGKLWKPVDAQLGGAINLYVCPDGMYHQLSIAAISDGTKYMADKYTIRLVVSTGRLADAKANEKPLRPASAVLIGNPNFGKSGLIEPLPGTEMEIRRIAKLMAQQRVRFITLTGDLASEKRVKEMKPAPVLHVATHGYFLEDVTKVEVPRVIGIDLNAASEDPMLRSGLLLANCEDVFSEDYHPVAGTDNGVLTAFEVQALNLENTSLAVLSACETGLGEIKQGEGVYGLQRALLIAGVKSVMMSLWPVSDEATMELMYNFYSGYLRHGDRSKAFSEAQKALRTKFREPHYWAAFVMLSD